MSKKFNTKIVFEGSLHERCGGIEYKMPKAMAAEYLKDRRGEEKKMRPNDYLVKIVNEQFGLLRVCKNVTVY